jgi:hypothetical protein
MRVKVRRVGVVGNNNKRRRVFPRKRYLPRQVTRWLESSEQQASPSR